MKQLIHIVFLLLIIFIFINLLFVLKEQNIKVYFPSSPTSVINKLNNGSMDKNIPILSGPSILSEKITSTLEKSNNKNISISKQDVLNSINKVRGKYSLGLLQFNPKFIEITQAKAFALVKYNLFLHSLTKEAGSYFNSILSQEGIINYGYSSEILATGSFSNSDEIVNTWLNSPDYKRIIFYPNYKYMGIGIAKYSNNLILVVGGEG